MRVHYNPPGICAADMRIDALVESLSQPFPERESCAADDRLPVLIYRICRYIGVSPADAS